MVGHSDLPLNNSVLVSASSANSCRNTKAKQSFRRLLEHEKKWLEPLECLVGVFDVWLEFCCMQESISSDIFSFPPR